MNFNVEHFHAIWRTLFIFRASFHFRTIFHFWAIFQISSVPQGMLRISKNNPLKFFNKSPFDYFAITKKKLRECSERSSRREQWTISNAIWLPNMFDPVLFFCSEFFIRIIRAKKRKTDCGEKHYFTNWLNEKKLWCFCCYWIKDEYLPSAVAVAASMPKRKII